MKNPTLVWTILFVVGGLALITRASTTGMGIGYQMPSLEADGSMVDTDGWEASAGVAHWSVTRTAGIWIAAIFTLCIFSFLYRDNPFYKFAEAVVVGVSAAYWMVIAFWTTMIPNLIGKLSPTWVQNWAMPGLKEESDWIYMVPLILSVLLLWRLAPRGGWIARWPLAFIIGTTAGLRMVGFLSADFIAQIRTSIVPLAVVDSQAKADGAIHTMGAAMQNIDYAETMQNLVLLFGMLTCIVYFFFSVEHKGVVGRFAKMGIWVLMITFGAAFGYTVMGRIALLAIRLEFLFGDWLWLIDPNGARPPM